MQEEKHSIPIKIKKYANRRLYNTVTSSYITLEDLAHLVKEGIDFVVYDAKSGDEITRHVLTQIILEKEGGENNLLPVSFLRGLIKNYDNNVQDVLSNYLDFMMNSFIKNQNSIKEYMTNTFKGMYTFMSVDHLRQQNNDILKQMMSFFGGKKIPTQEIQSPLTNIAELKQEIEVLQQKIEQLIDNESKKTT